MLFSAPTAQPLRHPPSHQPRDGDGTCHYATNFIQENWTEETMRKAAILVTNASYNRWQIDVLFQDIKGAFAIEQARVRTFHRLTNLIAIATLAFVYFAHHLPHCSEATTKLLKLMKDNQQEVLLRFRTLSPTSAASSPRTIHATLLAARVKKSLLIQPYSFPTSPSKSKD